jgi:hypothetical protein
MPQHFDSNMNPDTHNEDGTSQPCAEWQPLLTLLAAGDELDPAEQSRIAGHLAHCAACSAALGRDHALLALLAEHHNEPDATLLASCRAGLEDALDRQEERGWLRRTFAVLLPSSWISPRPAWSGAVLLLIGFSVGALAPRLLLHRPATTAVSGNAAASAVSPVKGSSSVATTADPTAASSAPAALDLHTADVAGINVFPSGDQGPPRVQLRLRAQQPLTVQGTIDDDDVKSVLLNVLRDSDRFCPDPDVRLDAVSLLRARHNDPDVRAVLCRAVRSDRNAAVRRKALEALGGADPRDLVRDTLLDALAADEDPGVRIEAISALRKMAARGQMASDDRVLALLRDRMQQDPSPAVRLQSAAALRALAPPPGP